MIYKKLHNIQTQLEAPKNLTNSFGGYKYRSCEGILEAVKPLLVENQAALLLTDEVVEIGGRHYIQATATLVDLEDESTTSVKALAREAETKKGMDDSQVTGTASSYARKYALNGLFIIDDTKDADTDEFRHQTEKRSADAKISAGDAMRLKTKLQEAGADVKAFCKFYGISAADELPANKYQEAMKQLERKINDAIINPA